MYSTLKIKIEVYHYRINLYLTPIFYALTADQTYNFQTTYVEPIISTPQNFSLKQFSKNLKFHSYNS